MFSVLLILSQTAFYDAERLFTHFSSRYVKFFVFCIDFFIDVNKEKHYFAIILSQFNFKIQCFFFFFFFQCIKCISFSDNQ